MLDGRYPSEEFGELRPRSCGTGVAGTDPRPPGRPRAGDHQRGHDPRPRALLRQPAGRPPRRRARRGDGLRGAAGPGLPARRDELADRGDHARPRDRLPAPGVPGAVPFWKGDGSAAARARRADRRVRALGGRAGPGTLERDYDLDPRRRATSSTTCASSRRPRRDPRDRTLLVEASATRWATGRCSCSPLWRPGTCRVGARAVGRCVSGSAYKSAVIWTDDGILIRLTDADGPPCWTSFGLSPESIEDAPGGRARRRGAVRPALPPERGPALYSAAARPPRRKRAPAVAAAPEAADPAPGGPPLRPVPDRARDLPRVPLRRPRRAGPRQGLLAASRERRAGRGPDAGPIRVPVRLGAAVRFTAAYMYQFDTAQRPSAASPP